MSKWYDYRKKIRAQSLIDNKPTPFEYNWWLHQSKHRKRIVEMTCEEFIKIWEESGLWHKIGNYPGSAKLTRYDKNEPLTYDNCYIRITGEKYDHKK